MKRREPDGIKAEPIPEFRGKASYACVEGKADKMIREDGSGNLGVQKAPGFRCFLFLTGLLCCLLLPLDPSIMEAEEKEVGKDGSWIEIKSMEEPRFIPPDSGAMDVHDPRLLPENWEMEDRKAKSPEMGPLDEMSPDESLFLAVGMGNIEEANRLLDKGAQINYRKASSGLTPLMVAEKEAVVRILLRRGANPNAMDRDGATPPFDNGRGQPKNGPGKAHAGAGCRYRDKDYRWQDSTGLCQGVGFRGNL